MLSFNVTVCKECSPGVFCKSSVANFNHCSNLTETVSLAGYWRLCWLVFLFWEQSPVSVFLWKHQLLATGTDSPGSLQVMYVQGCDVRTGHVHSNSYRESLLALP